MLAEKSSKTQTATWWCRKLRVKKKPSVSFSIDGTDEKGASLDHPKHDARGPPTLKPTGSISTVTKNHIYQ
jgi:hypothetical protein